MLIIFYSLLMLRVGCCTNDFEFLTKTVIVGQNGTLTCPLQKSLLYQETLYWIRLVSGNWPEFLGGTFNFDFEDVIKIPHITAKQENETFVLHINGAKINDTGLYYCIKVKQLDMKFIKGTFLKVEGPEPDVTAVTQEPLYDQVYPGDPVSLQCSFFFNPEKKTCAADHSVFWFRTRSDESHPSLIYLHGNNTDKCDRTPVTNTTQKCSFTRNIASSDSETYYCAVASCGEILFGSGTKLQAPSLWDLKAANIVLLLSGAALTASLIVIAVLVHRIRRKTCGCCNDAVTAGGDQQIRVKRKR
ncbi:uncharacterized protein LOC121643062 [Melanotaenia boesemani]|uniref:uncharacterized protein LOC121643062 n=1 Tax=Melanotaenia boesemani TaxID=1250792 RepID=UPI001C03E4ED|nr:uncharacterized protein LOC121643062 [Melanotaenia boesemani]